MPFYVTCPLSSLMLTKLPIGEIKPTAALRWSLTDLKVRHETRACSDHCFKREPPPLLKSSIMNSFKAYNEMIHALLIGKNNTIEMAWIY